MLYFKYILGKICFFSNVLQLLNDSIFKLTYMCSILRRLIV